MFLKIEEQTGSNIEQSELEDIFTEIVLNDQCAVSELQEHMNASGYNYNRHHQAVCIGFDIDRSTRAFFPDKEQFILFLKDKFMSFYGNIVCGTVNNCFVALLPNIESFDETERNMTHVMKSVRASRHEINIYCGIGTSRQEMSAFGDSIHEAVQTVRAMKIFSVRNQIKTMYEMLPIIMMLDVRDNKQLFRYRNSIVDPLYISSAAKGGGSADLAETLEMYLKYGRNAKLTAEKMYIHRNTLNMRLRKIEELIGVDLSDPEKCMELQFAIYVRKCLLFG